MLKLKTKTEFSIPTKRGIITGVVRFIIERLEIDINNIRAIGYYYYIDENNLVVKLDDVNNLNQWETIQDIEINLLPVMNNNVNIKENVFQRLREFTMFQLTIENRENYGTLSTDWENDID